MGTFWIYCQCFQERSQASSYYSMFHHDPLSSLSSSYGRSCGVASQSGSMGMVSSFSHLIFSPNHSGLVSTWSSHLILSHNCSLHTWSTSYRPQHSLHGPDNFQTGAYGSSLSSSSPGSGGSATSGLLGSGSSLPLQVVFRICLKFISWTVLICAIFSIFNAGAQPGPWACLQLLASSPVVAFQPPTSKSGLENLAPWLQLSPSTFRLTWKSGSSGNQ